MSKEKCPWCRRPWSAKEQKKWQEEQDAELEEARASLEESLRNMPLPDVDAEVARAFPELAERKKRD